ncbi:Low-affinity potassium transport protein [Paramyrothecium foliicola]|nr:Low-affinity potassium transport protein [Paramyrothecium foliicola]
MSARQESDNLAWDRSDERFEEAIKYVKLTTTCRKIESFAQKFYGDAASLVTPLIVGGFNALYPIQIEGSSQRLFVRVPCPDQALFPEEKTLAEAAISAFLSQFTRLPVPKVLHYGIDSDIGPFMIIQDLTTRRAMSRALETPREDLNNTPILNPTISETKLRQLYKKMARCTLELAQPKFPRIGSLSETSAGVYEVTGRPITLNMSNMVQLSNIPSSIFPTKGTTYQNANDWYTALADMQLATLVFQHNDLVSTENDCRTKFVARQLFRKLAREGKLTTFGFAEDNWSAQAQQFPSKLPGPSNSDSFRLWSDDFRPVNILVDNQDEVIGAIDWEFTYAAPSQFTLDCPWWLLLDVPEMWDDGLQDWVHKYEKRLKTWLEALKDTEKDMPPDSLPLSEYMRDSWDTGRFWLNYAARKSWAFDFIYWKYLEERFFGERKEKFPDDVYGWIIFCALLSWIVLYPHGNLKPVDAFFFGASASTESGLNTVDVKDLKTYQQVYIYIIPIITNLGFINIAVVIARIYWFRQRMESTGSAPIARLHPNDIEAKQLDDADRDEHENNVEDPNTASPSGSQPIRATTIRFDEGVRNADSDTQEKALHTPDPRTPRDGLSIVAADVVPGSSRMNQRDNDEDAVEPVKASESSMRNLDGIAMRAARSLEKGATSAFVLGGRQSNEYRPRRSDVSTHTEALDFPRLSRHATVGRNSQFFNLTEHDRELLGGIEYQSLKLLLKIVIGFFFGLHLFGVICLLPWIHRAPAKYTDWLDINGQDKTWWAFYSAQTMVSNLGFTLTPDSMITFRDATWPLLVMTFLAFAGNTCYPVLLRLLIWSMYKTVPAKSRMKEQFRFLLDHPRRCYTLLFPSKPTWILFGILFAMNFVDVLLIIVLDLDNPAVTDLAMGPRILSALFQAASARHTGTATLNLSLVNPGVQFSLLCMMYIAIFPIAIAIRASNTYEEKALGIYGHESNLDENNGASYIMTHIRNQLSFDLWYIFLGTFCICIAESERIMDLNEPAFSVFPVFFEVVSAYGNVGLSLGHPSVATSLCGQFTTFSKLVICAMMIRGRHRGLPQALDRAIMLPTDRNDHSEAQLDDGQAEALMAGSKLVG